MKRVICPAILALFSLGCPAAKLVAAQPQGAQPQAAQPQAAQPQGAQPQAAQPQVGRPSLQIAVRDAWIRWLPAGVPGAGFMTLTNVGPATQYLLGASSADFGPITLHQSRTVQGLRGMMPVDSLALAPNTTINLADRGYHLMLSPGRRNVHPGETVAITLRFAGGGSMTVPFEIRTDGY